jgi:hypothetical protein
MGKSNPGKKSWLSSISCKKIYARIYPLAIQISSRILQRLATRQQKSNKDGMNSLKKTFIHLGKMQENHRKITQVLQRYYQIIK